MPSEKNKLLMENYENVASLGTFDILSTGRYLSSFFGYTGRLGRFLADEMELKKTDRVLDAGCNVGVYHKPLAERSGALVGVDASPRAIERARARNKRLANARYQVGELLSLRPEDFTCRFDKILCYSVVHFLGDLNELEAALKVFISLLDNGHGTIFLGEVRETELYEQFKERQRSNLRDAKFAILKAATRWLYRKAKLHEGIPPTLFSRAEIEALVARHGGKCERIEEASWHPFYNTCADYRLRF